MRLRRLTLQNFRNIGFADLALDGRQHFLAGRNGAGKTNLLEAAGFVTALRSFRAVENKLLIARGQTDAAIACELEHERFGESRIVIKLRPNGKEVTCDGETMTKLTEFIGRFPTVVFSSQDQQLIRGAPAGRRRWLDLTLAAMDPSYLRALQKYQHALVARNALVKSGAWTDELDAFERLLAANAAELVAKRNEGVTTLSGYVMTAYARISAEAEPSALTYEPNQQITEAKDWVTLFEGNRDRDFAMKTTTCGPHRDDLDFRLSGVSADDFGSEGQQRSLVLAARLAQATYFEKRSGVQPVILADDVLGELDQERRRRFWEALAPTQQVIATGTSLPDAALGTWQIFSVQQGKIVPEGSR